AFKFVSAYSGILNEAAVRNDYNENHYSAMDAVIGYTKAEFDRMVPYLLAAKNMVNNKKKSQNLLKEFVGRWTFAKTLFETLSDRESINKNEQI
ncbi:MAG: hypothetical protein AABY15_04330, partial [Nanoarchaeota archaeon]